MFDHTARELDGSASTGGAVVGDVVVGDVVGGDDGCGDVVVGDVVVGDVVVGDDGFARCRWGARTPEYRSYHDEEWGRPVGDDGRVYEHLCLEGFQTGLSWIVILRKRDGFRRAFASFDPRVVASFGEVEVARLVDDPGIVRHRAKIAAAIANARATVALQERGLSLAALVWQYAVTVEHVLASASEVPSSTPESAALSKALRGYGFAYVGPTTVYAAMQSLGVVNDHLVGCHWHDVVDAQRRDFDIPQVAIDGEPGSVSGSASAASSVE